jgi:anti-sigma factor RsiW
MPSDDTALKPRSASWLLQALVAGLGGVLAAVLFPGALGGGLPRPVHAEVALVAAAAPSAPGLCFHGAGGELLDFASAGRGCR